MSPPSEALWVRASRAEDAAAIAAIYGHHVVHGLATFEETPPDAAAIAARRAALVAGGYPHLVAVAAAAVVGFAYAGPYRSRPAYRFTVENSVYVEAAGRGIGRALLGALIARCEDAGFRQMVAVIGDSANAASIGLHRALGFRRVGTLDSVGFKHGRWVDSVIMQRPLGPGGVVLPG